MSGDLHAMKSSALNVLYVSDSSTVSGAEIVMLHYLDSFRAPEYTTHVCLRDTNERLRQALEARGITYTLVDSFSRSPIRTTANPIDLARFAASIAKSGRTLARVIEERQIDLVHTTMYPAALYVGVASRLTGRPQIWHEHGIKRIHPVNRPIYRWVGRTCTRVIGPSDAVGAPIIATGVDPEKVQTIYNGIDLRAFDLGALDRPAMRRSLSLDESTYGIGLFGQMLPHKGHVTLIEAARAIRERFPSARFFLVGALENPPYEASLRSRLDEAGLTPAFTFTGWRKDVASVMAAMDVVVVPTLTPEPAALTLMEAMALERPLVASRTGGTAELVLDGRTGLLFAPGDAAALAAHVGTILADCRLAERLGRAGRQRMQERFSLDRHVAEIAELYRAGLSRAEERLAS